MATNNPYDLGADFGFPTPPDDAMVQALMKQLQLGNQAQTAQPRLDKQMEQAVALRDKESPRSSHWLSGLAHLGNKAAGIRDVRAAEAAQKKGEGNLANALTAQQQQAMQTQSRAENTALANTRLAQANRGQDNDQAVEAARLKAAALAKHQASERQNRLDLKGMGAVGGKPSKANNYGRPERIIIGATGKEVNARFDPQTESYTITDKDRRGEVIPYGETYVPGDLKMATSAERKFWTNTKDSIERANKYQSKSPEYWQDIANPLRDAGMPSSIMHKFIRQGETQGVYEYLDKKNMFGKNIFTEKQRARVLESMSVLSDLGANVINPFIEEGIAGAASDRDVDRLLGSIMIEGGTSGDLMHQQVNQLFDVIRSKASETAHAYTQYGDREAYYAGRNAQKYLDAYEPPPEAPEGTPGGAAAGLDPPPPQEPPPEQLPPYSPDQYEAAVRQAKRGNAVAQRYVEQYAEQAGR